MLLGTNSTHFLCVEDIEHHETPLYHKDVSSSTKSWLKLQLRKKVADMNRSKRSMPKSLRKKMNKEIRVSQVNYPVKEIRQYSDELTQKELLKKYPKKVGKKIEEQLKTMKSKILKAKHKKMVSKRTSPGPVPADSPPAHIHVEGQRWIKNTVQKNLVQRAEQSHKGGRKK
jgi:hypothetical protein